MARLESNSEYSDNARELGITKLTRIHGVARKTALAMYEIGIHDYADLIDYLNQHTAEEFSAVLKGYGVNRGPGLIDKETWIKEAEMLNQLEKPALTSPRGESTPEKEARKPSRGPREHDAVFTVSFDIAAAGTDETASYITVYNESNGGEEATFQGTDIAPWVNWMLERANLPPVTQLIAPQVEAHDKAQPAEAKAPVSPIPREEYDVLLEISDVQLSVTGPTSKAPEKKLRAVINIDLSGSDAARSTLQRIPFRIEIYTIELDSGFPRYMLSKEDQFKPRVFGYSYKLEFAMPEVGRYEFHSLVRLLPSGELKAYHQGPTLRVTP